MASADVEYHYFVGGLAWGTVDRSLQRAFSSFREVIESKIIGDREMGRSRGFEFVTFSNEQSLRDAIEGMNGQNLDGSITVNEAQSRGSVASGGGGGGGGFRNSGRHSSDGYRGGGGGVYSRSSGGGGGRDHGYGGSDGGSRSRGSGGGASYGNWRN